MRASPIEHRWRWSLSTLLAWALQLDLPAEPIPIRHVKGTVQGFLVLRSREGSVLAVGNLFQVIRGYRVTSRLLFRFKDGAVDDETTVFSQRDNFQLITDRHIQKGPFFPHPMDLSIDVPRGQVIVRSIEKDGKEKVETERIGLPPDLVNDLGLSIVKKYPTRDTRDEGISGRDNAQTATDETGDDSSRGKTFLVSGFSSQCDAL